MPVEMPTRPGPSNRPALGKRSLRRLLSLSAESPRCQTKFPGGSDAPAIARGHVRAFATLIPTASRARERPVGETYLPGNKERAVRGIFRADGSTPGPVSAANRSRMAPRLDRAARSWPPVFLAG